MNTQKTFIFFDLEQTLIDSFETMEWLESRASKIKNMIDILQEIGQNKLQMVFGIMSWAIWNDRDIDTFNKRLRQPIEEFFGIQLDLVWSMKDWFDASVCAGTRVNANKDDFFDCFTKEDVLFKMRNHPMFRDQSLILFDDAVEDMHLIKGKFSANTVNVSRF